MTIQAVPDPSYIVCRQPLGWYWGEVARGMGIILPESAHGPFDTAADAALDMLRTWVGESVGGGHG